MGVKRAFNTSLELARSYKDLCIFGDIVHNSYAVKELESRGVSTCSSLDKILDDSRCNPVVIRTHGIPPSVLEKLEKAGKEVKDLTCPVVKKIHLLIKEASGEGKQIIIFGKKNHPEVVGFGEYITTACHIVKNMEDARDLPFDALTNALLISQTTMNSDRFDEVKTFLSGKIPGLSIKNTLCRFPLSIQENGLKLAKKVDLMVIVGDKKSSNTKTLFEKVRSVTKALFVEHITDLKGIDTALYNTIGLAGGASTPASQLQMIYDYLDGLKDR